MLGRPGLPADVFAEVIAGRRSTRGHPSRRRPSRTAAQRDFTRSFHPEVTMPQQQRPAVTPAPTGVAEMVPIEHETTERVVRTLAFGLPPAALLVGGWLAWGGALHWQDLLVLAITYTVTGLGITVGFHRLFTHRSFK